MYKVKPLPQVPILLWMIPFSFWTSLIQGGAVAISSIALSAQRIYSHRRINTSDYSVSHTKHYKTRDLTVPFSNGTRLNRLLFDTVILTLICTTLLVWDVQQLQPGQEYLMFKTIGGAVSLLCWLYCLVLSVLARSYPLPDQWGWTLNMHLAVLFFVTLMTAIGVLIDTLWNQPNIPIGQALPYVLLVILGLDLVYSTVTATNGPPFLDENGKRVTDVNEASIFSRLFFFWVTPIMNAASTKGSTLSNDDLPTIPSSRRAYNLFYIFGRFRKENKGLFYRLVRANWVTITLQIILGLVLSVVYYISPYFLNKFLDLIQSYEGGEKDPSLLGIAFGYACAMSLGSIMIYTINSQIYYLGMTSGYLRTRAMLNLEIYHKTLFRADTSILSGKKKQDTEEEEQEDTKKEESDNENEEETSTGKIVNLMSTDSNRLGRFAFWWFVIIQAPGELITGIYLLYTFLGWSCILGLVAMVVSLPINHFASKFYARTQERLMEARDKRVSLMNELLQGIRQIKFFAWEGNWEKRVHESRNEELKQVKNTYISEMALDVLWGSIPIFVTMISFWSYTQLEGKQLTASVAFASIAVFSELEFAMSVIPEFISQYYEASISLGRIEKYLESDEIEHPSNLDPTEPIKIGFEDATIGWNLATSSDQASDNADQPHFTLKDLDIRFPNNSLSLICGSTGCGKTLMMLSLLGETEIIKGQVFCPRASFPTVLDDNSAATCIDIQAIPNHDTVMTPTDWILPHAIAYASQTPWLQNASIKDNILFGLPFLNKRYKETLSVCALDTDLDFLEDGDETEIGEKGITLSGGQKARVALARAVYSRAQNVFMDDVLSAVDARTGQHLYQKCLLGPLMKTRTLVLITHNISLCLPGSAHVVFIKDGKVELQGSPAELAQAGQLDFIIHENEDTPDDDDDENEEGIIDPPTDEFPKSNGGEDKKKPKVLIEEEGRASGMVKLHLYKKYFALAGNWMFWAFLIMLVAFVRFTEVGASFWIKLWTQSYNETESTGHTFNMMVASPMEKENEYQTPYFNTNSQTDLNSTTEPDMMKKEDKTMVYLMGYVIINMTTIVFGGLRFGVIYWSGLKACRALYAELLHRIFRAPLRFFDTTPVGRIINRFSKDFEAIDSSVPMNIINFIIQWIQVFSIVAVSVYVVPVSAVPMIAIVAFNIYLGSTFVAASRELKRMDSVSQSPLFILFSETIVGITTIRAFGMTREFMLKMIEKVDGHALPFYYSGVINQWISTRISFSGATICFMTAVFVLFNLDKIDSATAGFCLMYVLSFSEKTFWGVRRYTELELSFSSIERVVEFMEIDQEPPAVAEKRPASNWPDQGAIEVIDLEARYAADLNPVLKGLSFTVKPREKIGVVGRTGSGKSTLALSIFRFIELSRGKIIIDGIDISEIGTDDLRGNLTIIPQDPVLFSGTLRSNMDPFNQFSDEDIFTAFHRVQLLDQKDIDQLSQNSSTQEEGNKNVFKDLETLVNEGGKNFSQGQRQLLCLARALLKRNRVVLMDEATANVSYEMDKAIQKTMTTEFEDSTVLCIAHRIHSIIDYDRILVMDQGLVAEFASPYELLQDENSIFYKMCCNSGEFDSLLATAKEKHELLEM